MKITSQIKPEKIGTLVEGGGNITLGASVLNIGPLQYDMEGASLLVAATLTANTRFQIYAVLSGGVPILVVSANENSVGPDGYSIWRLVGSYSVNPNSIFGGFFNISDSSGSVKIRYTTVTGHTVTASPTVIDFDVKQHDTHNAVTGTGTGWRFTAPKDGYYRIESQNALVLTTAVFAEYRTDININGGLLMLSKTMKDTGSSTTPPTLTVDDTVFLNQGDYVTIANSMSPGSLAMNTGGWANHVSITEEADSNEINIEDL